MANKRFTELQILAGYYRQTQLRNRMERNTNKESGYTRAFATFLNGIAITKPIMVDAHI